MAKFNISTNTVHVVSDLKITDKLPVGYYSLQHCIKQGYYLNIIDPFDVPTKLYGDVDKTSDRIINTFTERANTTGVLLAGDKGSGKTLMAKIVANKAMDMGVPIILVNLCAGGEEFNEFLSNINQPFCLFFDEFEKIYKEQHDQNSLLTLLDGAYNNKMLAIFTSNRTDGITDPLLNRPGRIFYNIEYYGLTTEFVVDYLNDKLNNKTYLENIVNLSAMVELNFDQLKALVEEMNRYDESPEEAIQLLNIQIDDNPRMDITDLIVDGVSIPKKQWLFNGYSVHIEDMNYPYLIEPKEDIYFDDYARNYQRVHDYIGKMENLMATTDGKPDKSKPLKYIAEMCIIDDKYDISAKNRKVHLTIENTVIVAEKVKHNHTKAW